MIIFISVIFICISIIVLEIIEVNKGEWDDFILSLIFGTILVIFFILSLAIRYNGNPSYKEYSELKIQYDYISSHDSIPFNMKYELYEKVQLYNENVINNLENHESKYIGFYYPECNYELKTFNLNKIK